MTDRFEKVNSTREAIGTIAFELCQMREDRYRLTTSSEQVKELQELADKWNVPFSYDLCVGLMGNMYDYADWDNSSEVCGF